MDSDMQRVLAGAAKQREGFEQVLASIDSIPVAQLSPLVRGFGETLCEAMGCLETFVAKHCELDEVVAKQGEEIEELRSHQLDLLTTQQQLTKALTALAKKRGRR
jgi:hypothetical protein